MMQRADKRKLSVVLRDYDSETMHCNGINSMAIASNGRPTSCNLFTASRDRLIKIWHVDYTKMQSSMTSANMKGCTPIADLDDHTDWVNQIKLIEEVNTLVSCSNDTTIRIWRYRSLDSYIRRNEALKQSKGK